MLPGTGYLAKKEWIEVWSVEICANRTFTVDFLHDPVLYLHAYFTKISFHLGLRYMLFSPDECQQKLCEDDNHKPPFTIPKLNTWNEIGFLGRFGQYIFLMGPPTPCMWETTPQKTRNSPMPTQSSDHFPPGISWQLPMLIERGMEMHMIILNQ